MRDEKLLLCELSYLKCFSEHFEYKDFIQFRDNLIIDMYSHNLTYFIRKEMDNQTIQDYVEQEITHCLSKGKKYCNLIFSGSVNDLLISYFKKQPEVTIYGFYVFDKLFLSKLKGKENCVVVKVDSTEMVEEIVQLDLEQYGDWGTDFCNRRGRRNGKVYLAKDGVESFICYDNGVAIGKCDLFINDGVAKIEDFDVLPKYQRKGYGSALLKEIICKALEQNAKLIYLVTDEYDTAKEMYLKIGFEKAGEKTQLFFTL